MGWEVGGMFKREETSVYLIPIEVWKKPTQYCKASILQLKINIYIYFFKMSMFWEDVQSLSHVQLCNLMDWGMPGFPVLYHLLELVQTHVYWVSDATQPSHPLLSPSPPAFNPPQNPGLFQWVDSLHQ